MRRTKSGTNRRKRLVDVQPGDVTVETVDSSRLRVTVHVTKVYGRPGFWESFFGG